MTSIDELPAIYLLIAYEDWHTKFLEENYIGIGQSKGERVWKRFNKALRGDLVWLIPHGESRGAIGEIIDSRAKRSREYPIYRRKVKWIKIFDPEDIPKSLQRYKRTGTFTEMRNPKMALVEIYKIAKYDPEYDLYSESDLIENLMDYMVKEYNEGDTEVFIMELFQTVLDFNVEVAKLKQKGYDFIATKRNEEFFVEVKSGSSFTLDQIRYLVEEAKFARVRPWIVVTGRLTDKRRKKH